MFGHHRQQLGVRVAPFAHPANVDEVLPQQLLVLAVAEFVGVLTATCSVNPFPQLQIAAELAFVVVKFGVLLVRLRLGLHRAITHVLHRHGAGNDQHLFQRVAVPRLENHAAHTRVQRQAGAFLTDGSEV